MAQPDQLLGTPEWRGIDDYEVRKSADGYEFVVRGYAALFNSVYPVGGGPELGGFNEQVHRAAFDKTLNAKPDVHFLINHEGRSLARTKSGTLKLKTDNTGLLSESRVDRRTRDGQDLEISMERGDLDEMSFAFRTVRHDWTEDGELRTLLEVNLDKGDVSVVNNGANPNTRIRIATADAIRALSQLDLAEARSSLTDPMAALREARGHLDALLVELRPTSKTLTLDEALSILDGRS
ncbi:MAG TPA: HK97 family phage prohead protease [Propionibacteriaceae bacterium]|jgi:HK97 family phage prohead protease